MEEPYGIFGVLNPTGHNAIYFQRICAETPVTLRRCQPGEMGAVIARYQGIDGYDWVAIPLLPYLYATDKAGDVPAHVDRNTVERLRNHYRETHLESLGDALASGNFWHGGWTQLVGAAYERRIFAFRFGTTAEQDDALIRQLNAGPNVTRFDLLFNNCADFSREILNHYFPDTFRRSVFPDAGLTTPKQTTYRLLRYAHRHPETELAIFEIPQIPGCRRSSHSAKGIDESFVTTPYAIPIAVLNPYLAGGLFVDYLVRGRHHLIPRHPQVLSPDTLSLLTARPVPKDNSAGAGVPADRSSSVGWSTGVPADRSWSVGWSTGVPADRSSSVGWSAGAATDTPSSAEPGPSADSGASAVRQSTGESNPNLQGVGARNE